eukprot:scaffold17376_cov118-Isochrysis_galbana.AAC.5
MVRDMWEPGESGCTWGGARQRVCRHISPRFQPLRRLMHWGTRGRDNRGSTPARPNAETPTFEHRERPGQTSHPFECEIRRELGLLECVGDGLEARVILCSDQLHHHRLGCGQNGSGTLRPPQARRAVGVRAGRDAIDAQVHRLAGLQQVQRRLLHAHVRLEAANDEVRVLVAKGGQMRLDAWAQHAKGSLLKHTAPVRGQVGDVDL